MSNRDITSEYVRSASETRGRRRHSSSSYARDDEEHDREHERRKLADQFVRLMEQASLAELTEDRTTKRKKERKKRSKSADRSKSAPRTSRSRPPSKYEEDERTSRSRPPSIYEEDYVDEKLHKTKRALKSTRKKLSAQEERHSKEIQGLAAQLAQMRSELLAVSTSQLQMSTTDLVEDDSESILENSDYKMLTREETRSTPRVVSFADELDESRHPEKSSHTITTHSESTISGHSSSLRLRRQPRRGSTGSFLVDLVPDAFISIQGEQSSS